MHHHEQHPTPKPASKPLVTLLPSKFVAANDGPACLVLPLHDVMVAKHDAEEMICAAVRAVANAGDSIGRPTLLQIHRDQHAWRFDTLLADGDLKDQKWLQTEARKNGGKLAWSELTAEETEQTERKIRELTDALVTAGLAPRYFYKTRNGFRFVFVYDFAGTDAEQQKERAKKLWQFADAHGVTLDDNAVDAPRLMKVPDFRDEHGQASEQPWCEFACFDGAVLEAAKLDPLPLPVKESKAGKASHYDICITDYEEVWDQLDQPTRNRVAGLYAANKRIDQRIAELAQATDGRRGSMVFGLIRDVAVGINGGLLPAGKMDEVRAAMLSAAKNRADGAMTEAEVDALIERHTADRADRAPDIFEMLDFLRRGDAETDRICGQVLAGAADAPMPAEIPPAPSFQDHDLNYVATVGASGGPQTAKAKKLRDRLKAKHPKTADQLNHPDPIPQDQLAQVFKDEVAAIRHCKFDDNPTDAAKLMLALVRGKTNQPLAEQTALAWAALHAPKAKASERRVHDDEPRICSTPDGKFCLLREDGKWDPLPVPHTMLVGRAKELGVAEKLDIYRHDEDGNVIGTKKAQEIIDSNPSTSVVRVVGRLSKGKDDGATIEGMGRPEAVLNVPLRSIDLEDWSPLPPEQFEEIRDYYRHAIRNPDRVPEEGGAIKTADEGKLDHFLDCLAAFPREDHRTASVSIVGPGASGKDMLGEAEGKMSGGTAGVDSITGSFQEDLVHTSNGWVNETHGLDRRDIPRFSGKFRRLSGATRNNIARKFRSNIEVHRNYRWLFTANDDGLLHALMGDEGADGNLDGLAATSMRLARFEFTAGGVKWLADRGGMKHTNRPGAEWVGGDPAEGGARLVRFIADLARMSIDGRRPITHADPLGRFLVRGTDLASEGRDLLLARGIGPQVLKVVLGQARGQGTAAMVRWIDGCLFAQAQDIAEHITRTDHTKVSAKTVGHVLRHLSSATTNAERAWDGRRRWWQLDIKIIQAEAARQELSAEFLDLKTSN